jgi:hypothetical protein
MEENKMENRLYCGAAKINITPSAELLPYMFGLIGQQYGRVHDELFLRVIALGSGEDKALIVVYDLDKATNPEEWTALIEKETGVPTDNILYLAIHTHTAPLTGYRPFEGPNFIERKPPEVQEKVREYEEFLKGQLITVCKEALDSMVPAKMGYNTGKCYIGQNRCQEYRVKDDSGKFASTMGIGSNPEGEVNHTLLVVRFDNAETGEPIAFFTNYAVHCVAAFLNTCDDGKAFLSSDIGGTVSKQMEKAYPGAVALWTSAPAGDINPVQMIQNFYPDTETGAPVQRCIKGEDAADTILNDMAYTQLDAIRETLERVECNIETASLRGAIEWARTKYATDGFTSDVPTFDKDYEIRTHLLQIGTLALIGIDGELYTSLGQAMQAVSPVKDTFIINHDCSLLLNNPGYVMDDKMLSKLKECGGRGAGRGGVPGGGIYTNPGTVKAALEEATKALFK